MLTRLSPMLVVVRHPRFGRQMWALATLRQPAICRVTGRELAVGELAWRPMSNRGNRPHRIGREIFDQPPRTSPPADIAWPDQPMD